MRWVVVISIFIVLLISKASLAQENRQDFGVLKGYVNLAVTATVIDRVAITTMRDMNLSAANAIEGFILVPPTTSPFAGLMRIEGTPGKLVRITYLTTETLIEETGSGGIVKAEYRISGFDSDNQSASVLLDIGEATIRIGKNGHYYLWLGANVDVSKSTPGSYVSEFIIELEGN